MFINNTETKRARGTHSRGLIWSRPRSSHSAASYYVAFRGPAFGQRGILSPSTFMFDEREKY